jgi:chromosome segregation ATPase
MTDALIHTLVRAIDRPVHTLLHIGCGATPMPAYESLAAERIVLVEGDPEAFADLAAAAQRSGRSHVQTLQRVVRPQAGPVLWHRYNVRRLNAPESMMALKRVYPRLMELSQLPQEGVSLAALAAEVLPASDDAGATHALVLDVAGQEGALLDALPNEWLQRFRYVAIRGVGQSTGDGWRPLGETTNRLRIACFETLSLPDSVDDPLWPGVVLRLDTQALEREQLRAYCSRLEGELAQARCSLHDAKTQIDSLSQAEAATEQLAAERLTQLQQTTQQRDEQTKLAAHAKAQIDSLSQAKTAADRLAAERAIQLQQMTQQRDEQTKLATDAKAQIDSLSQAKTAADKLAAERATQLQQMTQQRDEQTKLVADAKTQIDSLSQAKTAADKLAAERAIQLQQMTQQRDEQTKLAADAKTQIDSLSQAKAAADKLAAERAAQLQQMTQQRDEQTKLAADAKTQIDSLSQAKAAAEKLAAERATQLHQMTEQRDAQTKLATDAKTQIDSLSQAKAAAEKLAAERASQLQQMTQQRDEQTKLAAERQQNIEALGRERAQLITERDGAAKERASLVAARDEQTKAAHAARQRLAGLEAEMADVLARHGLLQEELVKAEAQIELIADLLLRQPAV